MPWALPTPQQQLILELARGKYAGFNDSHLCEKLQAEENLTVSRETVRRIWRGAKLASPQKQPQESLVVYTEDWTDPPGPSDQRTPPGSRHHFATGQHRARSLLRRLQPTLPHPAAEAVRDFRPLPRRFDLDRCLGFHYRRVVGPDHVITLGAHAISLPPLPGHRGYAGETVELSHQLDGVLRVYRGNHLLLALPLPLEEDAERRPNPRSAKKRKAPVPRIYNLSGRPALAAIT